ncbi:MAG: glycosyltransferase family 2 protein [Candidatus Aenigmatarchaeota archaeon]
MKTEPLVTIIIPSYNRQNVVKECIKNVFTQSYKNWEIIVIDDGSKKPYFLPKHPHIKLVRNKINKGPAFSRNLGIELSKGRIVFILDDDIILTKNYLRILIEDLLKYKKEKVGGVAGRLLYPHKKYEVEKGKIFSISKLTGYPELKASFDTKKPVFVGSLHSCAVFWKEIFDKIKFDEETYKGNFTFVEPDFYFRMQKNGYKLLFEPKAVAYHLQAQEGGCKGMPKLLYHWYTIRNAFFFLKRFYGCKIIYMWILFILKKILELI